jgi:hypothetical protein
MIDLRVPPSYPATHTHRRRQDNDTTNHSVRCSATRAATSHKLCLSLSLSLSWSHLSPARALSLFLSFSALITVQFVMRSCAISPHRVVMDPALRDLRRHAAVNAPPPSCHSLSLSFSLSHTLSSPPSIHFSLSISDCTMLHRPRFDFRAPCCHISCTATLAPLHRC